MNEFFTFSVVTRQQVFAAGHLRKVVVEGSRLEIQCRIPPSQMLRMTDDVESDLPPPVVWVRFDLKGIQRTQVVLTQQDYINIPTPFLFDCKMNIQTTDSRSQAD